MRRLNAAAATGTPSSVPTSPTLSTDPTPSSTPPPTKPGLSTAVTIDPGAKARASGGAVEPSVDSEGNPTPSATPTLSYVPGHSPWTIVSVELIGGLEEAQWEVRHGAALGLLEIVRSISLPPIFLISLCRHLLTLLALDRFGDFVGDTVVAPVRETAAQALGLTLKYLDESGVREVHSTLMSMVKQPWAKRGKEADGREKWERFSWEIRHAGLLGLKYEVAVRADLLGMTLTDSRMDIDVKPDVKPELDGAGVVELKENNKPDLETGDTSILNVVEAAILA